MSSPAVQHHRPAHVGTLIGQMLSELADLQLTRRERDLLTVQLLPRLFMALNLSCPSVAAGPLANQRAAHVTLPSPDMRTARLAAVVDAAYPDLSSAEREHVHTALSWMLAGLHASRHTTCQRDTSVSCRAAQTASTGCPRPSAV